MSFAVSTALEAHENADTAAAVVKLLGTTEEGDIADYVDTLTASGWALDDDLSRLRAALAQLAAM